jgi:hypothetical protein
VTGNLRGRLPPSSLVSPGSGLLLCLLAAAALRIPESAHLPAALAGALAAPIAAAAAAAMVRPRAALWAGGFLALSPIHTLASRQAAPEALLVTSLLVAVWLLAALDQHGQRALAAALGLVVGGLLACGTLGFAAAALLLLAWLALRRGRRSAAWLAAGMALAVVAAAASLGLARSPFDYGEIPPWIPETTLAGVVRCAGASFTRVIGLEYQLVVPQARYAVPLTAIFVALMVQGAVRLPARWRALLLAGTFIPIALGAVMALVTGRVSPLQANRLLAALPFVALLMASGLASLSRARAWPAGTLVGGALAAFLALALAR